MASMFAGGLDGKGDAYSAYSEYSLGTSYMGWREIALTFPALNYP